MYFEAEEFAELEEKNKVVLDIMSSGCKSQKMTCLVFPNEIFLILPPVNAKMDSWLNLASLDLWGKGDETNPKHFSSY